MRVVGAQRRLDSGQRDLLQTFLPRRLAQRVEILALAGEKLLRLVELYPAVRGSLVGAAILAVGQILRAGPARFDDVPAIGGGFGVVDDQRGGGALAGRLLIFVGPAAVIGHRAAVELALGLLGLPVGIVDEDDDRLPLHIDPGVVFPASS